MGKEKEEVNEIKLSNQSDHSPVRQSENEERYPLDVIEEKKTIVTDSGNNIPNGKGGKILLLIKSFLIITKNQNLELETRVTCVVYTKFIQL